MLGLDLSVSFLVLFGSLQSDYLPLGKDQAILGHLCLQGFQTEFEGLQVVTQPDTADPAGRNEQAVFAELVGDPNLTPGRLLKSQLEHSLFDLGCDSVLENGFLSADLLKGYLSTTVI